jgi:hypothetical protein
MTELNRVIAWMEAATNHGAHMTVEEAGRLLDDLYQVQLFVNSVKTAKDCMQAILRRWP